MNKSGETAEAFGGKTITLVEPQSSDSSNDATNNINNMRVFSELLKPFLASDN